MGKSAPKVKRTKEVGANNDDDNADEYYRPFLIHSTTFIILTEQILALMPSERNVLLTMNEYSLSEINPAHPDTADSPTHVIIFCIRFIADDIFQPIGGLLIYKYEDQSALLAECLKAFIHDLWILGVYVVATVSPPFETFKAMLNHLVDIENFSTYSGVITYSVAPFKEIVHIYDIQFLLIKLQNLLKEGDIKFVEGIKEYRASWDDVSLVLNISAEFKILSNYLSDNKDVSRRVHIFTQQIFEQFLEVEAQGALSKNAGGSAVLLNCIRTFLQFTELDLVNLSLMHGMDCWDGLTHILQTMIFQKSKKRTCTKIEADPEIEHLIQNGIENLTGKQNGCFEEILKTVAEDNIVQEEPKENNSNCIKVDFSVPQNRKQKKRRKKKSVLENSIVDESCMLVKSDASAIKKQHLKQPYENNSGVQQSGPAVAENVKPAPENNTQENVANEEKSNERFVENEPCCKTDNLLDNSKQNNFDKNVSCDRNNNGDNTFQKNSRINQDSTTIQSNCDNKIKIKKDRNSKNNIKEERFDFVINDAQKFFQCFSGYTSMSTTNIPNVPFSANCDKIVSSDVQGNTKNDEIYFSDVQETSDKSNELHEHPCLSDRRKSENVDSFCSQSDEETEHCITSSCDKVPNIIELLNNAAPDDFEQNNVTFEMLCTVSGMRKVISNLTKRRVRIAKPDAFVVEHIDFLVTMIKRDKNNINPVYYYGHNYGLFNAALAFATLHNKSGLYLVSK